MEVAHQATKHPINQKLKQKNNNQIEINKNANEFFQY